MKILAVDTAANTCSVAVADSRFLHGGSGLYLSPGKEAGILTEISSVTRQTHSKHLMGMIRLVLEMAGMTISDVQGFAVAKGPGSFTGLRIGISTIKGLAAASGKPAAGVSNLDALAFQFPFSPYPICTLLDARKGEVYSSFYRFENGNLKKEGKDRVISPGTLVSEIREPCLFAGNGALLYRKTIQEKMGGNAYFAPACHNVIRASSVARLSLDQFEKNDTDGIAPFEPHYIRKSDAELGFGKKKQ